MTTSRKKPGVAFWATVVVVVALVAYPLSYGPWIGYRASAPRGILEVGESAFRPIQNLCDAHIAPEFYRRYLNRWSVMVANRQLKATREYLKR